MEEGEKQTILRQKRMTIIIGGPFTDQEMEEIKIIRDPDLKISRTKKYLPGYISLWPYLREVGTQCSSIPISLNVSFLACLHKNCHVTESLLEKRIANCSGCHIENAGKVAAPLHNYHTRIWVNTVITTDGSSTPFFPFREGGWHSPEWHLAHGAFKFVYEGSYGKKCSSMVHSGLRRGSRKWETVQWRHLTAVSKLWFWQAVESLTKLFRNETFELYVNTWSCLCSMCPGRNLIYTVSSHVSWTL